MKKDIIVADVIDEQICKLSALSGSVLICDPMSNFINDMDIGTTIQSLPKTEKEICLMLLSGCSPGRICKLCNISKKQYQKHLTFIRNRFIEYGFERNEINFL